MRISHFLGFLLFASFAVAADESKGGCGGTSASVNFPDTTTDGGAEGGSSSGTVSKTWPTPAIPRTGSVQPMTCEWLDGDNCWKRIATQVSACAKGATTPGSFTADRRACAHPDGTRTEFAGPIDSPPSNLQVVDSRIVGADGSPCYTGKILGLGKVSISSATESVLFESTSLTEYQVTCADGTTFANHGEGTCPTFGARYLSGRTPGTLLSCDSKLGTCIHELKGGPTPNEVISRCAP